MGLVRDNAVFQSLRLMTTSPSPKRRRTGVLAVVALVAVSVLVMGGWFIRRAAWEGAVTERLGGYAAAPLPAPDAPVDSELADLGADIFQRSCSACHTLGGGDMVGPDLAGVTVRRDAAWIQGMILRPDSMVDADPDARALKDRYQVLMVTPGYLEHPHALAVLEFLRRADSGGNR